MDRNEHERDKRVESNDRKFLRIISSSFGYIMKTNIIFCLKIVPCVIFYLLAVESSGIAFVGFFLGGLVCSVVVGPALSAACRLLGDLWMEREGLVWKEFKRAFTLNWKATWLTGVVFSVIIFSQYYAYATAMYFYIHVEEYQLPFWSIVLFMVSILLFAMITPYFFLQAAYIHLNIGKTLTNSVLLALANAPRSLVGAVVGAGLVILQFLFIIYAAPIVLLIGLAFPLLFTLICIWKPFDTVFKVEETLLKNESERNE